jgi:hypothetical protein
MACTYGPGNAATPHCGPNGPIPELPPGTYHTVAIFDLNYAVQQPPSVQVQLLK